MSKEITRGADVHPIELLPFYVNGTLPADERSEFENHLASCPDCRCELVEWEALAAAVREEPEETPDPARVWAGFRRRVEPKAPASPGWKSWFAWRPIPPLAWGVAAVQLFAIIILGAYMAASRVEKGAWTTLGGGGIEAPAGDLRLQVVFQPNAAAGEISSLLSSVEGQIVQGPSAHGVYVVAVPSRVAEEKGTGHVVGVFSSRGSLVKWVQHEND